MSDAGSVPQVATDASVENALSGLSSAIEHGHEIATELHDSLSINLAVPEVAAETKQPSPVTTVDLLLNHIAGLDGRQRHLNERLTQALQETRRLRQ